MTTASARLPSCFLSCFLASCGGAPGPSAPAPATPPPASSGGPASTHGASSVPSHGTLTADTPFLRLRVVGTPEAPRIESAVSVTLPAGSVRPAPLGGDVGVIPYAGDTPLELRFADLSRDVSYEVSDGEHSYTFQHTAGSASCDVFVVRDPGLTHVELVVGERTVFEVALSELEGASGKLGARPLLQIASAQPHLTVPGYPHIPILGSDDMDELPSSLTHNGWVDHRGEPALVGLADPTPAYVEYFRRAFERVQPEVAATVRGVGVARLSAAGQTRLPASACPSTSSATPRISGGAKGGVFLINSYRLDQDPEAVVSTLVHETAHVFQEAIDEIASRGSGWEFVFPNTDSFLHSRRITIPLLHDTHTPPFGDSTSPDGYTYGIWEHTHNAAVGAGLAQAIPPSRERVLADTVPGLGFFLPRYCAQADALAAGSASIYGASAWEEDIAEYASAIQFRPREHRVCRYVRERVTADEVPGAALVHVAKAAILLQAGFVSAENFRACVGELPRPDGPGMLLRREDGQALQLGSAVRAGFGEMEGKKYFRVTAEDPGTTYAGLFTIYTPRHVTPVGLHRLNTEGFGLRGFQNEFLLNHEGAGNRRASAGGLVLITEALDGQVRGALIDVPLRGAFGVRSQLGYAPFHVPRN